MAGAGLCRWAYTPRLFPVLSSVLPSCTAADLCTEGVLSCQQAIPVEDPLIEFILSPAVVVQPPSKPVNCTIQVPGSKSGSNRALLLAALAEGRCEMEGLLHSDDTQVCLCRCMWRVDCGW